MSDPIAEDDRQFEQVLNRLDALMKRSHGEAAGIAADTVPASAELPADLPVLTERYTGPELQPLEVAESRPPVLTEIVSPTAAMAVTTVEEEVVADTDVELSASEAQERTSVPVVVDELEALTAALLPALQARIALVVQEELRVAQDNIVRRLEQEAEQMLRQQLSETPLIPK